MNILVIDDDTCRHTIIKDFVKTKFTFDQLFWLTHWPDSLIETLQANNIQVLFLDHDLRTCDVSFMLSKMAYRDADNLYNALKDITIIVHSMNVVGASNIKGILDGIGIHNVIQYPLSSMTS